MNYYPTGYSGHKPADLILRLQALNAILVDIRLSPRSRIPDWQGGRLRTRLSDDRIPYIHIAELGNVNYKNGLSVVIADMEKGIQHLEALERDAVLLCGCKLRLYCHRTVVAEHLQARGHSVLELEYLPELAHA